MTYQLQPGTIPYRVHTWLRLQPAGAEFSSSVIAEELGIEPASIVPCLKSPYNHGLIAGRQDDRRVWHWSLGDGVARTKPADNEPDEPMQQNASKPAQEPKTARKQKPAKPELAATPDPEHFRVGHFSDGTVVIERDKDVITLTRAQADQLAVFLQS